LEARTAAHKLPLGPTVGGGPSRLRPLLPHVSLPRVPCYHTTLPPHHRRAASASASTPPATATRPSSSATTCSPLPPNSSSPSPPLAMPSSASASINWLSNTALSTSSSASMRPDNMPTICSTSCTAWAPPAATLPVPPLPSASLCPAVIPNASGAVTFGSRRPNQAGPRPPPRSALSERPTTALHRSLDLRSLRQVASPLQPIVRQRTRLINQFHHLLALTFPELALLTKDLA